MPSKECAEHESRISSWGESHFHSARSKASQIPNAVLGLSVEADRELLVSCYAFAKSLRLEGERARDPSVHFAHGWVGYLNSPSIRSRPT